MGPAPVSWALNRDFYVMLKNSSVELPLFIFDVVSPQYVVCEPEGAVLQEQDLCVQQGSLYNHPVKCWCISLESQES